MLFNNFDVGSSAPTCPTGNSKDGSGVGIITVSAAIQTVRGGGGHNVDAATQLDDCKDQPPVSNYGFGDSRSNHDNATQLDACSNDLHDVGGQAGGDIAQADGQIAVQGPGSSLHADVGQADRDIVHAVIKLVIVTLLMEMAKLQATTLSALMIFILLLVKLMETLLL